MENNIKIQGKMYSNLDRPVRWNGIIDYKTLITILLYIYIIWNLTKLFTTSIVAQIYIIIMLTIPFAIFIKSYINETDITFMLVLVLRFCFTPHLYVYDITKDEYSFLYDHYNNVIIYKNGGKRHKLKVGKHKKWHKK